MSLKLKLILVAIFEIAATVALAGFFGYRESKWEIKKLARELLVAKTEQAYSLCEHYHRNSLEPSEELKNEIAAIKIAKDGYIAVLDNTDGPNKGVLIIHPSDAGLSLYNDNFPHIKKIHDEIDANKKMDGYANFTVYRQHTEAKGLKGEEKIGYFMYFAPWNWVILSTGYEKDVFASRDILRQTLIQVFLVMIVLGSIAIYLSIGRMFKPVQRLTDITQEVARGNWNIAIDYHSNDEIGALSKSFNGMVQSLRENARMWQEFNVARDMQAQMLPKEFPTVAGLQISAKSLPAKEVGGDFYDFLSLPDGRLGIVVGDVSGHSVSAAMVMTAAMSAMRFAAEEKQRTDETLNLVNTRLNKDIQNHMFVALFYGIIDLQRRRMYYTNAGQTMPFLWRDGRVAFLPQAENSDRFPLGIVKSTVYEQLSFDLQPGDILIFYTDGIVDAMNGHSETFGFDRLSDSIQRYSTLPPGDMLERLVDDMNSYCDHASFNDDVTMVIVKILGV
jgi:serine phosphatase RsbU (regulator of sigma subunit)